jgi:hypothetical protein
MDEIDLEQEFQMLMRTVIKQIGDKRDRGELTDLEAADLLRMVEDRMQAPQKSDPDRAWSSSNCYLDDDGWMGSRTQC